MNIEPSRRAILSGATTSLACVGVAAFGGAAAVVPAEAKSRSMTPAIARWREAMAAYDQARRADDEINAVFAQVDAARGADLDALPTLSRDCRRHFFGANDWKILVTDMDAHEEEWFAKRGIIWNAPASQDAKYRAIFNEVRDLQAARAAIDAKHAYEAIEAEWDHRGEVLNRAEWTVFDTPAPDLAALAWKIEMLKRHGRVFDERHVETLLADVRRLEGEVRA